MSQKLFFALAAVCLLVPCLALTEDEAKAIVHKESGEAMGETKAKTAIMIKATMASASTPSEIDCIKSKIKLLFLNVVTKVKQATREIIKFGIENWQEVSTAEATELSPIILGEYKKVISSIVKENEASLKQCLA